MKRQLQVVYENGVYRPLEAVPFAERQRFLVTINDDEAAVDAAAFDREAERKWLREQGPQFLNEWVALEGSRLVSHGMKAKTVYDEARAAGVMNPYFVRVTAPDELPSGGW